MNFMFALISCFRSSVAICSQVLAYFNHFAVLLKEIQYVLQPLPSLEHEFLASTDLVNCGCN